MANLLEELPKIQRKGAGGRRGSKYPFDEWFDGQVRQLDRGTPEEVEAGKADYSAKTESIVNMLHTKAASQNLKLRTVKIDGGNSVALVALPLEENETETSDEPKKDEAIQTTVGKSTKK